MQMIARRPAPVKSSVILFAPSHVARLQNPRFGILPQRGEKLPIGPRPDDARWAAEVLTDWSTAPTESEVLDRMACLTMSRSEFEAFQAEIREAEAERAALAFDADWSELRSFDPMLGPDTREAFAEKPELLSGLVRLRRFEATGDPDCFGVPAEVEPSFSDDLMDAMAEEARQLDAACGFDFSAALVPAPARQPRRRPLTMHQRSKLASKAAAGR